MNRESPRREECWTPFTRSWLNSVAVSAHYRSYVQEQLERITHVTSRSMFGGVGLYADGLFFGLLADDRIYLKVDDTNRGDFEQAGMSAFRPFGHGAPMKYYELPGEFLDDPTALRPWVEKAIQVARQGKRSRLRSSRRPASPDGGPGAASAP